MLTIKNATIYMYASRFKVTLLIRALDPRIVTNQFGDMVLKCFGHLCPIANVCRMQVSSMIMCNQYIY